MQPGQILVADHNHTHVIKMVGDVRLTLCVSFDKFIDSIFHGNGSCGIVFDLTEASAIDSTTLGLMAKIAILSRERCDLVPVVFSTNPSVDRLLETMGFDDIFEIVHEQHQCAAPCRHLKAADLDEQRAKERILEAHHILMELNESNRETFRDLVNTLEGR
ncbi:MAG: STAS domain-containing protein [Cellvibrionaceae bacterium]